MGIYTLLPKSHLPLDKIGQKMNMCDALYNNLLTNCETYAYFLQFCQRISKYIVDVSYSFRYVESVLSLATCSSSAYTYSECNAIG